MKGGDKSQNILIFYSILIGFLKGFFLKESSFNLPWKCLEVWSWCVEDRASKRNSVNWESFLWSKNSKYPLSHSSKQHKIYFTLIIGDILRSYPIISINFITELILKNFENIYYFDALFSTQLLLKSKYHTMKLFGVF